MSISVPTIPGARSSVWMRPVGNSWPMHGPPCLRHLGSPARHDPEYARGGVVNLFLSRRPLRGWRHVCISDQRTRTDFARCIRELVDSPLSRKPSGSCW